MALTTNTYVAVVNEDHTVLLPVDVPVGSQVAIYLLPEASQSEENADRQARFARVMAAIRDAQASNYLAPEISDAELNERIARARKAYRNTQTG
jgi:hypothetical protein